MHNDEPIFPFGQSHRLDHLKDFYVVEVLSDAFDDLSVRVNVAFFDNPTFGSANNAFRSPLWQNTALQNQPGST